MARSEFQKIIHSVQMHLKQSKITELFALVTGIARSDIYAPHICDIFVTFFRHLFGEKPIALNSKHRHSTRPLPALIGPTCYALPSRTVALVPVPIPILLPSKTTAMNLIPNP